MRFDAERSAPGLVVSLVEQLADESSLDWLRPLGFFGDEGRWLLVHAVDGQGRDLDPRSERSVSRGGARSVALAKSDDLSHVMRLHWSFVGDGEPAGVELLVRTQRPASGPHPAAAEVSLQLSRADLLAPSDDVSAALAAWLDRTMVDAWVVSGGVVAKTDPQLLAAGQRMAVIEDPFRPYVWDYSWLVVLPPECVERLGGIDEVLTRAPTDEAIVVSTHGGESVRLRACAKPELMNTSTMREWRDYLAPVMVRRRQRARARFTPEALRFVLDDEVSDDG